MNEDYIRGIKFLLKKSKEQGINIHRAQWIPNVSKMLSEHNLCYKFWYNVNTQRRLQDVLFCETWYDVLYANVCLFEWAFTYEGYVFWDDMFHSMLLPKMHSVGFSEWTTIALKSLTLYQ